MDRYLDADGISIFDRHRTRVTIRYRNTSHQVEKTREWPLVRGHISDRNLYNAESGLIQGQQNSDILIIQKGSLRGHQRRHGCRIIRPKPGCQILNIKPCELTKKQP